MGKLFVTSMARHANFTADAVSLETVSQTRWADGQFVVCEVTGTANKLYRVELASGRRPSVMPGDRVLGVLGRRAAALEFCGDWRATEADGAMHCLTAAGLFGKLTSKSELIPRPMSVRYLGHAMTEAGHIATLSEFVPSHPPAPLTLPVVQVVGTSMSAGKTTTARLIVRALVEAGFNVAGAKMIGAGGHKDALNYQDAGAMFVCDFVDMGLPSTAVERSAVQDALTAMLGAVQRSGADVLVAELGAAPHDPYHGDVALELLDDQTVAQVLVAGDAYGALGFVSANGARPDIVTGLAAITEAARHATRAVLDGTEGIDQGDIAVIDALSEQGKQELGEQIVTAVRASIAIGV